MFKRSFKIFRTLLKDADVYQQDQQRADALAGQASHKAERQFNSMRAVWDDLTTFIRMIHAWAKGSYRHVPWKSMAWVIAGVVYFVSPIDAIPDFIPFIGYMDDAFVITIVMRGVRRDVERFREWEGARGFDLEHPQAAHS